MTTDDRYCLILGAERSRDRALLGAARASGLRVAVLHANARINKQNFADIDLSANSKDPHAALEAVVAYAKRTGAEPSSVIPLTDMTLETGLAIATHYGLPYLPARSVALARDKYQMRQAFQEHGLAVPRFVSFHGASELDAAVRELGLPVVIKPRNAGGSEGVQLVRTWAELEGAYRELAAVSKRNKAAYGTTEGLFLVEQYIDAQHEVSVEVLNGGTRRLTLMVTDKHLGRPPHFVEMGHSAPSVWSGDDAMVAVAHKACEALGVDRGLAHVEIRRSTQGEPVIVEVNARPAGGSICDLVESVTGTNILQLHCESYLTGCLPIARPPQARGRAAIAFLEVPVGKVDAVRLPTEAELPDHVVAVHVPHRVGDETVPCIDSNTRVGWAKLYWPDDDAKRPLSAHFEFARELARRCIHVTEPVAESP